MGMSRHETCRG